MNITICCPSSGMQPQMPDIGHHWREHARLYVPLVCCDMQFLYSWVSWSKKH